MTESGVLLLMSLLCHIKDGQRPCRHGTPTSVSHRVPPVWVAGFGFAKQSPLPTTLHRTMGCSYHAPAWKMVVASSHRRRCHSLKRHGARSHRATLDMHKSACVDFHDPRQLQHVPLVRNIFLLATVDLLCGHQRVAARRGVTAAMRARGARNQPRQHRVHQPLALLNGVPRSRRQLRRQLLHTSSRPRAMQKTLSGSDFVVAV
mmetsp:Transcript_32831/g.75061  ORF Transcript_32831/g.75061 Transcript_32831/m.75061 type:complete len:204 (-) Transcript_32831:760-1371(-)